MISRGYAGLPPSARGQRIGLFGGSFNPPHDGHRAASLIALRRLRLDRILWLVTQGNPLKDTRGLPSVAERLQAARKVAAHPAIEISGFETSLGSPYTYDLLAALATRRPGVRFVLIMGADSFESLHHWRDWRRMLDIFPIAVIDRPGFTLSCTQSRAGSVLAHARWKESRAGCLATSRPPSYAFLHGPRSETSSTALRRRGRFTPTTILSP